MAKVESGFQGFREASRQLSNMKKATAQGVGRRSLMVPAEMLARGVRGRAAVLTGDLYESVDAVKSRSAKGGKPRVSVVAANVASVQEEFGNGHQVPNPFFRPEIDSGESARNAAFVDALMIEVDDTVLRAARKAARKQ